MAYETRANKIFDNTDVSGLTKEEIINKAMQEHNLKKITATNYYYEWSRQLKSDKPKEKKLTEDEAAAKILEIMSKSPELEPAKDVREWTRTEDEEKAAEIIIKTAAAMQIKDTSNRFKLKKMQFSGDNGEYYIDKDCLMLSNAEGSLTFSNESEWHQFKSEIDEAFKYVNGMEVLN